MKRVVVSLFYFLSLMFVLTGNSVWAEGRQHSLGIDVVRALDEEQYGGMLGLTYQVSLGAHSAVVGTLAQRSGYTIFEGMYKVYGDKYFDGPFAAAGVVAGRYDGDREAGVIGALGYELSLDQYLVISGAVECTWGTMNHPSTSHRNPIFRPVVTLIFAF